MFGVPQAHSRCCNILELLQGGVSRAEFEELAMSLGKGQGNLPGMAQKKKWMQCSHKEESVY